MAHQKLEIACPLADPFLITRPEGYYLTGTHHGMDDESRFELFFSKDLARWKSLGNILTLPNYPGSEKGFFWAPEIFVLGDKFYLYYTADSNRDPEKRYVRVAVADAIEGPYQDMGALTQYPSIDGHPFIDIKGNLYLMYTGNEGNPDVGQLMIDRLIKPDRLAGEPRKVYPSETVEWEEGAFTLICKDRILLFSSTGNWRDGTYRIIVSQSDSPEKPFERLMVNGRPYVLLATEGERIGPGHCSLFRAHDGTLYLCYHAWDIEKTGRYPWIVPLTFDNDIPRTI
jgi:beta-xylosidase